MRTSLKSLSLISIKASFYIWLSRYSKEWSNPTISSPKSSVSKAPHPAVSHSSKKKVYKPSLSNSSVPVKSNCGLLNKGNTCYVNSALQCFSVMIPFWSSLSLNNQVSPFVSSFVRIMSMLRTSKANLDPSNFLRNFTSVLTKAGRSNFNIHHQQDVAEAIGYILEEIFTECAASQAMINVAISVRVTCNTCFQHSVTEDSFTLLQIPVEKSTQLALDNFLKPEELCGEQSYFCNVCASFKHAGLERKVVSCGRYLVFQIKRFTNFEGSTTKDTNPMECSPIIKLRVVSDDVRLLRKFRLIAVINHSGNLTSGHYTANIRSCDPPTWWFCNDGAVIRLSETQFKSGSCYICFYEPV